MSTPEKRPAVFLDRDGVLNASAVVDGVPRPPADVDAVELLDGTVEACQTLRANGVVLVMITNQPDIARGTTSHDAVDAINEAVASATGIDHVLMCPHDDIDRCRCRKPAPGMILDAAEELGLDLARSATVGDRWRDIDAGTAAGIATVFVDHGWPERRPEHADLVVGGLDESLLFLLQRAGAWEARK